MDFRKLVRERLSPETLPAAVEDGVVEELAQHVEDRFHERVARGEPDSQALERSLAEIDDRQPLVAELRRSSSRTPAVDPVPSSVRSLTGLWQDIRFTFRILRRTPGFAVAAVLTVALSTGPTLAALGVANWMFWRPLPHVQQSDQLGIVWFGRWNDGGSFSPWRISYGHLGRMQETFSSVADVAGFQTIAVNVAVAGAPARIAPAQTVSANYFDLLGVRFSEGRPFRPDEDRDRSGALVAVISPRLASTLFPDDSALGRTMGVNGWEFTIVGVTPDGFEGLEIGRTTDLWFTGMTARRLQHAPPETWEYEPHRGPFSSFVVRLEPGATFERAQAEFTAATAGLAATGTPETEIFESRGPTVFAGVGLNPLGRAGAWRTVRLLMIVGGVLMILGAANLANLFLFRGFVRLREAVVRLALGASTARIARLQVIEALLVSLGGATLGLLMMVGLQAYLRTAPIRGLGPAAIVVDWRLVALLVGLAVVIAAALSLAPNRLAARATLTGALAAGSRAVARPGGRLRTGLMVVQLALSLTLLAGGLLFIQTLDNLRNVDPGFHTEGVRTMRLAMREQGYDADRTQVFYRTLLERLESEPGIDAVAAAMSPPLLGSSFRHRIHLPGQDPQADAVDVVVNDVSSGYFDVFRIPFVAGRTFTREEAFSPEPEPGVILSRSLAEDLFGTPNVVGRLVTIPAVISMPSHDVPVIGVAADTRWQGLDAPPDPILYRPFGSSGGRIAQVVTFRSTRLAEAAAFVRSEVARLDPALPVSTDETMGEIIDARLGQQRLFAWVLGVLAALGFLLATVGVHGLFSQVVTERWREFGIRLAVGASRRDVIGLVLRGAAGVIVVSIPLGIGAAMVGSRLIEQRLFGIDPLDTLTYAVAAVALVLVVLVASLAPARRAAGANPVDVLRAE